MFLSLSLSLFFHQNDFIYMFVFVSNNAGGSFSAIFFILKNRISDDILFGLTFAALPISCLFPFLYFMVSMLVLQMIIFKILFSMAKQNKSLVCFFSKLCPFMRVALGYLVFRGLFDKVKRKEKKNWNMISLLQHRSCLSWFRSSCVNFKICIQFLKWLGATCKCIAKLFFCLYMWSLCIFTYCR